jgi:hypothetical protein
VLTETWTKRLYFDFPLFTVHHCDFLIFQEAGRMIHIVLHVLDTLIDLPSCLCYWLPHFIGDELTILLFVITQDCAELFTFLENLW